MPDISAFSLRPSPPLTSYMVLKIRSQTRRACECKPVHVFITVAKNMGTTHLQVIRIHTALYRACLSSSEIGTDQIQ